MALYNPGFPATYQSPYLVQPYQQSQGIIWVSGEAGAKAYLVAPNTTVQLWDSENQTIYLKSADASGMPSMRVLDYTMRENGLKGHSQAFSQQDDKCTTFALKSDLEAIRAEINAMHADIDSLKGADSK